MSPAVQLSAVTADNFRSSIRRITTCARPTMSESIELMAPSIHDRQRKAPRAEAACGAGVGRCPGGQYGRPCRYERMFAATVPPTATEKGPSASFSFSFACPRRRFRPRQKKKKPRVWCDPTRADTRTLSGGRGGRGFPIVPVGRYTRGGIVHLRPTRRDHETDTGHDARGKLPCGGRFRH